jgi:hypothetical protein
MDHLAEDLPRHRVNILAKVADVRGAGKGGSVEKLQDTIEGIKTDLGKSEVPRATIGPSWSNRQQRSGKIPQRPVNQRGGRAHPRIRFRRFFCPF